MKLLCNILAAALLLSSCRSSRLGSDAPREQAAPRVAAASPAGAQAAPEKGTGPPAPYAVAPPAPDAPGWQHRQYRRNLRAQPRTVPLIQGRAAVNAPQARQVVAAYKPRAAVVLADSGSTVQVATAGKNAQAAAGEGNRQERTEAPRRTFWQRVTSLIGGLTSTLSWLLLGAVLLHAIGPGVGYGSGWLRRFVSKRQA